MQYEWMYVEKRILVFLILSFFKSGGFENLDKLFVLFCFALFVMLKSLAPCIPGCMLDIVK